MALLTGLAFSLGKVVKGDVVHNSDAAKVRAPVTMARDPRLFPLFASLNSLDGVGPTMMAAMRRLLEREEPRVIDLLLQPPLTERPLDALEDVSLMSDGAKVTLAVQIGAHSAPPKKSRAPYKVAAFAGDIPLDLIFFHARGRYVAEQFPTDSSRLIHGRLASYRDRWQMAHPEIVPNDPTERQRAGLVYALSEGITQVKIKKLIEQALRRIPELPEWLAEDGRPGFKQALYALHGFDDRVDRAAARARLALDELSALQFALVSARKSMTSSQGRPTRAPGELAANLLAGLAFKPTGAQLQAMAEIRADMAGDRSMLRLLMGDVGSGKTLVALSAMLDAVECGRQAVLMAPTEILTRQHAQGLRALAAPLGIKIGLLIGSEKESERRAVKAQLADGSFKLVVGTHALFQEDVEFDDLALAVIDEQHRFGVNQRMDLLRKGRSTDLLLMTATPIPRSLILARYGDVDTSRLWEKPPGRQPIKTVVMATERLEDVIAAIGRAMADGGRVYWVCPVIEQALDGDTPTAEDRFALLSGRFGDKAALVHGRLKPSEKETAMQRFASGAVSLLVATTVIEVGVDVPEATVIVIDGAEHFGLAQLHQLRGRVGRGTTPSSALLLYNPPISKTAQLRLAAMRETEDGFEIAEQDLKLRGPGEVLGSRQSGFATLRFANMSQDEELVDIAREDACAMLECDPGLESPRGLALRRLLQLFESPLTQAWLDAG